MDQINQIDEICQMWRPDPQICKFTIEVKKNPKIGKEFLLIIPSKKAIRHIKAEIKNLTWRKNLALPKEVVIGKLNEVVRGWTSYFYKNSQNAPSYGRG